MADLLARDLLEPKGEIALNLFPAETADQIEARASVWLAEGFVRSSALSGAARDDAARQWAYYRAWNAVYTRLISLPSSVTVPAGGGHGYSAQQLLEAKERRDLALELHKELVGAVAAAGAHKGLPNPVALRTIIVP
jgi:hypothetical protein